MPQATHVYDAGQIRVAAPAALVCGDVVVYGLARILVYEDKAPVASGDPVALATWGVKEMTALSTDTGSIDTVVYWDNTNKRITTTSGSNTRAGRLVRAKFNAETTALVDVNAV